MYPSFSSVSTAVIWILNDLYVDRGNRRLGIAKALLEFAAEWAQTNGSARLVLETARDNTPAKSLYENLGWKLDEEFDRYTLELK
jgi:GNAT superfamily N-acetyltransferase